MVVEVVAGWLARLSGSTDDGTDDDVLTKVPMMKDQSAG